MSKVVDITENKQVIRGMARHEDSAVILSAEELCHSRYSFHLNVKSRHRDIIESLVEAIFVKFKVPACVKVWEFLLFIWLQFRLS